MTLQKQRNSSFIDENKPNNDAITADIGTSISNNNNTCINNNKEKNKR